MVALRLGLGILCMITDSTFLSAAYHLEVRISSFSISLSGVRELAAEGRLLAAYK